MTKKRIITLILTICMIVSTAFVFTSCDLFFFLFPEDYEIPEGSAEFHFVDVGQGDATLIFADGKTILIDTGEKDSQNVLINYLKDKGIETINYFIITHFDSDHFGEATEVLENFEIENLIIPDQVKTTKMYTTFMAAVNARPEMFVSVIEDNDDIGDMIEVDDIVDLDTDDRFLYVGELDPEVEDDRGDLVLEFFGPVKDTYSNSNDYSIIVLISWGQNSILFTGDAEEKAEEALVDKYPYTLASKIDCDVFKAGHHGSRTSSTDAWLAAVRPTIAVISCGKDNSYGHPHAEVLARIAPYVGENIYRTDELGSIVFVTDGEAFIYQD